MGRNPVYIVGLALFLIFNVPIVEAKNNATILAFRFLTGFVGSPALATGVSIFIVRFSALLRADVVSIGCIYGRFI